MKLDGIEVFVEVVEAQSFIKAALRLRMPPATVSAKIARLEERLGVTLIQRTTRKLHVTAAGRSYYEHCARALAEMGEAQRQLAAATMQPTGRFRMTAPADLAQTLLPPLIERFLDIYPTVSVELAITNRKVDLLAEGIDLAIRVGPLRDSTLTVRKFRSGRIGLWASPVYVARMGLPKRPGDLSSHRFVTFTKLPKGLKLRSGRKSFTLDFEGRIASDDLENVRTFLLRGNGIGVLPEFAGQELGGTTPLVRILPEFTSETATIFLAYPAQRFVPHAIRAFIAIATGDRV